MRCANPLVTAASMTIAWLGASAAGCGGAPAIPPSTEVSVERDEVADGVPPPEARLTSLEIASGPMPETGARAAVARSRDAVRYCLVGIAIRVEGRMDVRLRVAPDGQVARSGTDAVEGLDPEVVFCIVRALRSVRFPAAEADSIVRLRLAFSDPRRGVEATAEPPPELAPTPPAPETGADEVPEEAGSGGSVDDEEPPPTERGDESPT